MIESLAPNRVTRSIDEVRAKCAGLEAAALAQLDADMAVDFEEHFAYQNLQALAHASGWIATDEAQIVYRALGEVGSPENGGWAAGVDTATKVVVTMLVGELMRRKMALHN